MPALTGLPLANILRRLVGTLGLAAATFRGSLGTCIPVSIEFGRTWNANIRFLHQLMEFHQSRSGWGHSRGERNVQLVQSCILQF